MYSKEQVVESATRYFAAEALPASVWTDKYALKTKDGSLMEVVPSAMHERLAGEFARIDAEKYGAVRHGDSTFKDLYLDALSNFSRIVLQGSPMAAVGNPHQVMSASNCVVVASPHDSIAGIMKAGTELAQLMKRRCGVGIDISTLRPDGMAVNNAARTTSGAWSFADFFSYVTRMIGQCLSADTAILTRMGLKEIKNVTTDDEVWTKNGWVRVIGVIKNSKPTVKLTTSYGREVICSKEHVFHTIRGEKSVEQMVSPNHPISTIIGDGWEGRDIELNTFPYPICEFSNKSNRLCTTVKLPQKLDAELAYFLGYSYGDGYIERNKSKNSNVVGHCISLATSDDWPTIREKLISIIKNVFNYDASVSNRQNERCANVRLSSTAIVHHLEKNGLLKQKAGSLVFPQHLNSAKPDVLFAFISGLFDADGDVSVTKKAYRIRSICKPFLLSIQNVLTAFGIPTRISAEDRTSTDARARRNTKNEKDIYTLSVNGRMAQSKFYDLMGSSVKIRKMPLFIKKRDFCRTAYTTADFSTRASKHSYVIDDRQFITFSTADRLLRDTGSKLKPRLLQDYVTSVEEHLPEEDVYDLMLESEHLFFANGLYAHNSGRRGALMVTIDVHHPDVVKFARMKSDLKKVTGANVSIRLSNDFMAAVEADVEYEQYWPPEGPKTVSKMVRAREVWDVLIDQATKFAEPGLIYWDTMTSFLPAHSYKRFRTVSTNPCCFAANSTVMVKTDSGLKEIKTLGPLDKVWIDSEKIYAACSGYFSAGLAEVFSVTLSSGTKLFITANHKLEAISVADNSRSLAPLSSLSVGSRIACDSTANMGEWTTITSIESIGMAEVGCISVETYHKFTANGIISGNSEIALSPYDSCRLISLNLTGYVRNAFTNPSFDFDLFKKDIRLAARMADNLVDLELELIRRIQASCDGDEEKGLWQKLYDAGRDGRRVGLGTHGLADMLAQLCIKYDSEEALSFVDKLYSTLLFEAYNTSVDLAIDRGPFPEWSWEVEKDNAFIQNLPAELKARIQKHGRRNIAMLTQAPTGSISIISKCGEFDRFNVSSGVEPVFRNFYIRRKKINSNQGGRVDFVDALGDQWQEYPVFHPNVKNYFERVHGLKLNAPDDQMTQEQIKELLDIKLPSYFVTSDQIDWTYRVKLQGVEQRHIDHSISSTTNLPKGTTSDTVGQIYLEGWKAGLKGITVYVDGSRDGVLITESAPKQKSKEGAAKRPKSLKADVHTATVGGNKWVVLVGLMDGAPYEVFTGLASHFNLDTKPDSASIVKLSKGRYDLEIQSGKDKVVFPNIIESFDNPQGAWATRLVSLSLRHNVPLEYIVDSLSKDGKLNDINRVLARVLKKYMADGKKVTLSKTCTNCNSSNLLYQEGCPKCLDCGYTKCN